MLLKINRDEYGLNIQIKALGFNYQTRVYKDYQLAYTFGIRNTTREGKRILFLDYDDTEFLPLLKELEYLQEEFNLSEFYIFKSSQKPGSFHAICLDKLRYKEMLEIMQETTCDENYRINPPRNDHKGWVLRGHRKAGSLKPVHIHTLKSEHQARKKSRAHHEYLKRNYDLEDKPKNLDNNTIASMVLYGTMNFIDKKIDEVK